MINWVIEQQSILCLTLIVVIAFEHFLSNKLAPKAAYKIWVIIPLMLIVNNIPLYFIDMPSTIVHRYLVGINNSIQLKQFEWLGVFWLEVVWLTGTAVITVVAFLHYIKLYFSVSTQSTSHPNMRISNAVSSPLLIGIIKPKIIVPTRFEKTFCPLQQQMIIEHENTHWRSLDHLWNLIALVFLAVFWFNPLMWIGCRYFRIHQEMACDSIVLTKKTEHEKLLYAKALVQCAEFSTSTLTPYPQYGDKYAMLKRLNSIKKPTSTNITAVTVLAMFIGALMVNTAIAQITVPSKDKESNNEATPIVRINPIYPLEAIDKHLEGSVVLKYDITATGKTSNIQVVESYPENVFDSSAKTALTNWKYKPKIVGGKALAQRDLLVQLDFKFEKSITAPEIIEVIND